MKNKGFFSLLLTISILLGCVTTVFAEIPEYGVEYSSQPAKNYTQLFKDVAKSYWAFDYIMEMEERGVLSGYPNGNFYPNNTITRGEFSKIMCLAANMTVNPVSNTSYDDVKSTDWFAPYVEAGKYYLSGYVSDGKKYYMPNDNALREDIAVALVKLKGYDTSLYDESILKAMFTDWQSISEGARKYVSVAVEKGLISGYEDDTFRGQNTITRAEAATLLWRAYQYGNGNKVFEKEELEPPTPTPRPTSTPKPTPKPTQKPTIAPTPELEVKECLELSLKISKTKYTVEANESVELVVNVEHNMTGEFEPVLTGDAFIIESSELIGSSTVSKNIYQTKELEPGQYEVTFSITDDYKTHSKTVNITVNEPEPEYTYELTTLADDVNDVYAIIATDDSVIYLTKSKVNDAHGSWYWSAVGEENVIEIKKDSTTSKTIASSEDIKYLGLEEMSKADEARLKTYILALGYNKYDKCPYIIIKQFAGNCGTAYYLYNLYTNEFTELDINNSASLKYMGGHWDRIFAITKLGEVFNIEGFLYRGGALGGSVSSNRPVIINDTPFIGEKYVDTRTGKWETLDYYVPDFADFLTSSNNCLYFIDCISNTIYMVDANGDYEVLCTIDDIDNIDGKAINMESIGNAGAFCVAAGDDGTIYYIDDDYGCIRQLSEK